MAGKRPYDQSPERELSPESEKFGSIIMPKGSFRRPAITKPFNQLACILHIEKLNPSLDDAPLHSITREWLDTAEEELPEDSNKRILRFMHEHEAYGLKDNKPRFDKLVKELIIGTEIQALEDYDLVVFEPRVMDRLRSLSRNLSERSFINHIDGKLIKTEEFLKCWESRDTYWKANAPVIESVDRSAEADEGFNEDVVPERPMTPPRKAKRSLFTPKALASGKLLENTDAGFTPVNSSRKKRIPPDNKNGPSAKRQRTSKGEILSNKPILPPPPAILPSTSPIQPSVHSDEDDNVIEEAVRFGQEFLSSSTPDPLEALALLMPQQKEVSREPTIPICPGLSSRTSLHGSPGSHDGPSDQVIKSLPQTPGTSYRRPTPTTTPSRNLQITFIFQRQTGFYNLNDGISAAEAHDFFSSSLSEFFKMAAKRFCMDVQELDCVTFRYGFGGFEVEIVHIHHDASLDDWNLLRESMRRQFNNSRMLDPLGKHFDVLVGPGES